MGPEVKNYIIDSVSLNLEVNDRVFNPTTVSSYLMKAAGNLEGKSVLDLGSGVGPIAIVAAMRGAKSVHAVDIMSEACSFAVKNVDSYGLGDRVKIFCGDMFFPIRGNKYDIIIDDVPGISERISRVSGWYPPTIPTSGEDGTDLTLKMLHDVKDYMVHKGKLYFPTGSIAKMSKIVDEARRIFGDGLEEVLSKRIPFCPELVDNIEIVEQEKAEGNIEGYEQKRSRYLWELKIFEARMPI